MSLTIPLAGSEMARMGATTWTKKGGLRSSCWIFTLPGGAMTILGKSREFGFRDRLTIEDQKYS
jgi:hypothetical protein